MKDKLILFDFDGVISNTLPIAFEVAHISCPDITLPEYRRLFEGNINETFGSFKHNDKCHHNMDFDGEYFWRLVERAEMVAGIDSAIKELAKSYKLVVISSTISSTIAKVLEKFGLSGYFEAIYGNDIDKSKVRKIRMIFDKYRIGSKECVLVTDTLGDIRESACENVGSIAVSWGFHDRKTLAIGKPFRIIESPDALICAIGDYYAQPPFANSSQGE